MSSEAADPLAALTAAGLFALLWDSMADLLGTAATAALLRRALRRAAAQQPVLSTVATKPEGLTYRYTVPPTWQQALDQEALAALRELTRELYPLLVEMTGSVVVRRLARVEPLRRAALAPQEEVTR
jgi:hypothetical protein